jgi:glycosyltransferase involved in cell wall biosynthesis
VRVLHVLTRDYRRGAETFGMQLHQELLRRGVASFVVALAPAPEGHAELGVRVLGSTTRRPATLRALRRAAADVDVVVAHGSATLPACRLALLGSRVPFVYANIGDPLHWAASPTRRARVMWMLRGAAAVGAIAPSGVERVVSHLKVPRDRVTFTGNGRDPLHFSPATPEERALARTDLSIPDDAPVAVAVGALAPEKCLEVAIDAVASLPDWRLVLVGAGRLEAHLRARAEAAAPGRIHFTGEVTDVRPALHAADVAVLTSRTEGLPGVLVEAALCSRPLVATRVGFVPDIVANGRGGRLVPVGDVRATAEALDEAWRHRSEWGAHSRALAAERFGASRVADRWTDLLLQVVRRTGQ